MIKFFIILFLLCFMTYGSDSSYTGAFSLINQKYPTYTHYPMVLFPYFKLPKLIVDSIPKCAKRVYIDVFTYDILACSDRVENKHIQVAYKSPRQVYRLFFLEYIPITVRVE